MGNRVFCLGMLAATLAIVGCGGSSSSGNASSGADPDQTSPAAPDFSLSVPTEVAVTASSSQTISIAVAPANGFSSTVSVTLAELPTGVTATPASFTLIPGSSPQTVVITASASAAPGPVSLVVMGTSGSLSNTVTTATTQADFALSGPSQPIALPAGGTAQLSVSADGFNGFGGQVSAALAGLPAGVTASPSTLTLTPGVAQTITLTAAANAQPGSSTLTLQGTSGALSSNLQLPLALSAAGAAPQTPGFSLSVAPSAITLAAGGSPGVVTLSATAIDGFAGPISVALSGLPNGVVAMPAAFTLTPGTPQQISLTAAATDTAAAATLVFNATAGTLEQTTELAITITPPPPSFTLQVAPAALTLNAGGGAQSVSVTATALYGFSGQVNVVLSGLPAGMTASPAALTLTPGVAQTVSLTAGSNTAAGTGFLNLLGTSGAISNSASVGLTINTSTPDFVFSATPSSVTVTPGTFQPVTLSIIPLSGFNSAVTVTTGSLPDGVVVSPLTGAGSTGTGPIFPVPANFLPLAPNVPEVAYVGLPSGDSSPVTIDFQATAGALAHSATVTANPANNSNTAADLYLSAVPTGLLLFPGEAPQSGSPELEISAAPFNTGGTQPTPTISLTSSLPSGMTSTTGPLPAGDTGLGMNFTVGSDLVGSSGILTFQALSSSSSGSMTREIDVPYSVVAAPEYTQLVIPSTLTLPQGATEDLYVALATTTQSLDPINPSTITLTGLPFGVTTTATTNFSTIFPSVLSEPLAAAPSTAVGSTPVTVTTTASGGQTQTSQFTLNIVSIPNFTLTATPTTFDMMEGTTQTFTLEADAMNGFTGDVSVTLTASGDVTASPSTFTLTPGTPQQISVTAANTSGGGSIVVQATAGTLSQTLVVPVDVTPPGPDFSVVLGGGFSLGAYASGVFQIQPLNGFAGTVTATITGFPPGLFLGATQSEDSEIDAGPATTMTGLYSICPPIGGTPYCQATYFATYYDGAAAGTYPLTLTATYTPPSDPDPPLIPAYPITHTYQYQLVVTPPSFSLSASPVSLSIAPGASQSLTVTASQLAGYSVQPSFYLSGLPSGVTATMSPTNSTGGAYTTEFVFSAASNAAPGSSMLTIQAVIPITSGEFLPVFDLTQTVQVPLVISP